MNPPNPLEALMSLSVGDVVEAPSFLAGMTTEATLFQVIRTEPNSVTFRLTFFGVPLKNATLTKTETGDLSWK